MEHRGAAAALTSIKKGGAGSLSKARAPERATATAGT